MPLSDRHHRHGADLWRSTGSAAFLIAQPLLRLGADPVLAIRITFIPHFHAQRRRRLRLAERPAGRSQRRAGRADLCVLPIFVATVYVRGSVSGTLVLAFTAWRWPGLPAMPTDARSWARPLPF